MAKVRMNPMRNVYCEDCDNARMHVMMSEDKRLAIYCCVCHTLMYGSPTKNGELQGKWKPDWEIQ